jgi:DNA-directed RNA polymerase subunit L
LKVNILKKTDKEIKIEIEGAGHGLCNLLQKKLLEEKSVDMAGYDIPHPLASNPVIYVRTKGFRQRTGKSSQSLIFSFAVRSKRVSPSSKSSVFCNASTLTSSVMKLLSQA